MRIAIGGVQHETNTFSKTVTDQDFFQLYEWLHGEEITDKYRGVRDYLGGLVDQGDKLGVELVPTFAARATPSGLIPKDTYKSLKGELIAGLQSAGELDAICLALHGAGVAEGHEDLEGALLSEIRNVFGNNIPVVATLDLHANMTTAMVENADALFGVNEYPHTDCYERGLEAMEAAVKIVKGELKPVMHLTKMPLMFPASTTYSGTAQEMKEYCLRWEETHEDMVRCTFFHAFSRADIEQNGSAILTITNDNEELAKRAAEETADQVWAKKEGFFKELPNPMEGLEQALQEPGHPIVINEGYDNPGGGSSGDSTRLLAAMLEKDEKWTTIGFIYDSEVAGIAHEKGVGATIDVKLGGKSDNLHGDPLQVTAYVKSLTDGKFIHTSKMNAGKPSSIGNSARLQIGNVDVIVGSIRTQTLDEQLFLLHGIDVHQYKVVGVKSSVHFRAAFREIADKIITIDAPGLSSYNLEHYDYKHVRRPMYPLDQIEGRE